MDDPFCSLDAFFLQFIRFLTKYLKLYESYQSLHFCVCFIHSVLTNLREVYQTSTLIYIIYMAFLNSCVTKSIFIAYNVKVIQKHISNIIKMFKSTMLPIFQSDVFPFLTIFQVRPRNPISKPKYHSIRITNKIGRGITRKLPCPSELKKYHLLQIENYFPQCTDTRDFISAFKQKGLRILKEGITSS